MKVTAPDGRTLEVHDGGDPGGRLVIFHHGTPSYGCLYPPWEQDARRRGVRLVGFDRAGYGGSSRRAGRNIGDVAADAAAIADALGVERFATWGVSGGGPHALACAALLPERIVAAACLCSPAPYDADGLDWLAGQGEANVAEHEATLAGEATLRPLVERDAADFRNTSPEALREQLATLLSEVDAGVLDGALAEYLHEAIAGSIAADVSGWLDDDLAFVAPWGFDPAAITVPVLVRHGEQDRFVPASHGRWLAGRIPGADARITAEDGHLTLFAQVPDVHEWLLSRF